MKQKYLITRHVRCQPDIHFYLSCNLTLLEYNSDQTAKNYTRMSETSINHHLIGQATNPKLKRDWHVALAPRSPVFRKMRKTQITQAFNERMNYNMIPFHKSLFR